MHCQSKIASLLTITLAALTIASGYSKEAAGDISLKKEVEAAIHRSLVLLEQEQFNQGYWSGPDYPAITALILRAYLESPVDQVKWQKSDLVAQAIDYLKANARDDGGIYNRGLGSYNTAISLMTLKVYDDVAKNVLGKSKTELSELRGLMEDARRFVVRQQQLYPEVQNKSMSGGIGYGNSYPHSDLSNTSLAIQSLHETRSLLEGAEVPFDLDWDAAIQFLENTQNLPDNNQQDWSSNHPEHRGGFVYFPGNSKAGSFELSSGATVHRSYGSMSYAGLMSFLYAGLEKEDERVTAAVDWLKAHFTLNENPGMELQGLFYYYYTMAKALDAWGEEVLTLDDGSKVRWRHALAEKLLNLEKHPGYWVNTASRWQEGDPNLVSAYTLLALQKIYPKL